MSEQKFLLSHTPTTEYRVSIIGGVVGRQAAVLIQQTTFELDTEAVDMLVWFLRAMREDAKICLVSQTEHWLLEFEPTFGTNDLEDLRITRRATGHSISMALATAWKLLRALTGETERLVKEEHA